MVKEFIRGIILFVAALNKYQMADINLHQFGLRFVAKPGPTIMRIQNLLSDFGQKSWIKDLEIDGNDVEVSKANKGIGNTPTSSEIMATGVALILGKKPVVEEYAKQAREVELQLFNIFQAVFESAVAYEKSGGNAVLIEELMRKINPRSKYELAQKEVFLATVPHQVLQDYVREAFVQGQNPIEEEGIQRSGIAPVQAIEDLDVLETQTGKLHNLALGALEIQFVYSNSEAQQIARFAKRHKLMILDLYQPISRSEISRRNLRICDIQDMKEVVLTFHSAGSISWALPHLSSHLITGPQLFVTNLKGSIETHFGTPSAPQEQLLWQLIKDPGCLQTGGLALYFENSKIVELTRAINDILSNNREGLAKLVTSAEKRFRELYYNHPDYGVLLEANELLALPGAGRFALRSLARCFFDQKKKSAKEAGESPQRDRHDPYPRP